MLITGLSYEDFCQITKRVSERQYGGNVIIADHGTYSATRFRVTLRVASSSGKGARRTVSGRKCTSACWHAHRDIMIEMFRLFPHARLRSGRIGPVDYKGIDGFHENYPATGNADIGSQIMPVYITELCECGGNVPKTAAQYREEFELRFAEWSAEPAAVRAAAPTGATTDAMREPDPAPDWVPGTWHNTISPA